MDCSAFRRHHLAYVDDTLPGDLVAAAARHAAACPACARHDTAVRRSLLLARNMADAAPVRCSDDFAARLEARLEAVRMERRAGQAAAPASDDWTPSRWELASSRLPARLRTRPAAAAAAALVALSAGSALRQERAMVRDMVLHGAGAAATAVAPFGSPFSPPPAPLAVAVEEPMFQPDGGEMVTWVVYDGGDVSAVDAGALVVPAATGAPVWAAAMLAGEVPAALWRGTGARAAARRGAMGPAVQLIGDLREAR